MNETTQNLILGELRDLRAATNEHAQDTVQRLSKLESQMAILVGNGQPGRISILESKVQALIEWRWWVLGSASGVGTLVSVLLWLVRR